jgi:hypothetical protein
LARMDKDQGTDWIPLQRFEHVLKLSRHGRRLPVRLRQTSVQVQPMWHGDLATISLTRRPGALDTLALALYLFGRRIVGAVWLKPVLGRGVVHEFWTNHTA